MRDKPFLPAVPAALQPEEEGEDMFAAIRRQDVLLHHPFDSFQPVVTFLQQAARDPAVLAIKVTLYRVGRNSPVVEALLDAVGEGKQVAALVELKARFDEESDIEWGRALERDGVHVVYGLPGLKVHCKTTLVVRREAMPSAAMCIFPPATTTALPLSSIPILECSPVMKRSVPTVPICLIT